METKVFQISSLEKVRSFQDIKNEVTKVSLLGGERFSYQLIVQWQEPVCCEVQLRWPFASKIYLQRDVVMDFPKSPWVHDGDYLAEEPGLMPDLLVPLEQQGNRQLLRPGLNRFWVELRVPEGAQPGDCRAEVTFSRDTDLLARSSLQVRILPQTLPENQLLFTQWFHVDCIATVCGTEIYSEAHWEWIRRYMELAADLGINTILTPVITPPLDTAVGTCRPNTQLVKISRQGTAYGFDFGLLRRWIGLCRECGITHLEISHLFSQWGAEYSPNIYDQKGRIFGWDTKADDPEYLRFLEAFLPRLVEVLRQEGMEERTFFHISDEPGAAQLESYARAKALVQPLLGKCRIMDALSHYDFYENGLVETPVCATDAIEPFLDHGAKNLWAYYCCAQAEQVGNRFLSMPAYRNRILGLQLYKFRIQGFLHWGFNYYYSQLSRYPIDPAITTSADGAFPSGDPFSVYPGLEAPRPSMRAMVFYEAMQDLRLCRLLEQRIGRARVTELIDEAAGMELTFSQYPRDSRFLPALNAKMKEMLQART